MKKFFDKIPGVLSSSFSIFIFLFLFIYLFIIGIAGLFVKSLEPSGNMQLILGNYTNVTSALGAAISAGAATAAHKSVKKLHEKNDKLSESLHNLHEKNDALRETIVNLHSKHDSLTQSVSDLHDKVDQLKK